MYNYTYIYMNVSKKFKEVMKCHQYSLQCSTHRQVVDLGQQQLGIHKRVSCTYISNGDTEGEQQAFSSLQMPKGQAPQPTTPTNVNACKCKVAEVWHRLQSSGGLQLGLAAQVQDFLQSPKCPRGPQPSAFQIMSSTSFKQFCEALQI